MRPDVTFVVLALLLVEAQARGPLCLDCLSVRTPRECTRVTECGQNEVCFGEITLLGATTEIFSFGCRSTQNCQSGTTLRKRSEFRLCDSCCHGDICNNNVCTNGTAPPPGIPCLECSGVSSAGGCSRLTYCQEGEVCYTLRHPHSTVSNMGCLQQKACGFFGAGIIGRRSQPEEGAACHKCCDSPGCNHDICDENQISSTVLPEETTTRPIEITTPEPVVHDCWDVQALLNKTDSGHYQVTLNGTNTTVYCDMETDGGGWTVFQRRYNGTVGFNRTYNEYRRGFGNSYEFWLGNEKLHQFTSERNQTLRVDVCRFNGSSYYAEYSSFFVDPASDKFRLNLMNYSGDAGDALLLNTSYGTHSGQYFSARDMDNDRWSGNCAKDFSSGWWFDNCYRANLNGVYSNETRKLIKCVEKNCKVPLKFSLGVKLTVITLATGALLFVWTQDWDTLGRTSLLPTPHES